MTRKRQQGFTLLEVIIALTITGFVLGGLFSLVGGSKQLSWRSEESLLRATQVRAAINFALLENEYRDVEPILEDQTWEWRGGDILEFPERKTEASIYTLQNYEVSNPEREQSLSGSRWIQLELPR